MEPKKKLKHFMYVPFTGLGLYNGFRGNRWLKNRIKIFKQFVVPSLQAQTSDNFTLWISWRWQETSNPLVQELRTYLTDIFGEDRVCFTYAGVCFYDDKYPDAEARERLVTSIHGSLQQLIDFVGEADHVLMTIQPSDDLYHNHFVEHVHNLVDKLPEYQAFGFQKGFICNYNTLEVAEYNPETNPPFYTIKFPRGIFTEPRLHAEYTALKHDADKYPKGTPLPSHEYVGDCLKYAAIGDLRGFMVGTHGANISTTFNIPYKGAVLGEETQSTLRMFGIYRVDPLEINISFQKRLLLKLPFKAQRKIRYWISEILGLNILS